MLKYSLFLIIASMWFSTVLCVGDQGGPYSMITAVGSKDNLDEKISVLFQALSIVSAPSNAFVKFLQDSINGYISFFEDVKKEIQYLQDNGTEMEKTIHNISLNLKNFTKFFTKDLQSELEEIESNATTDLIELNGKKAVNDIDSVIIKLHSMFAKTQNEIGGISVENMVERLSSLKSSGVDKATQPQLKEEVYSFISDTVPSLINAHFDVKRLVDLMHEANANMSKIHNGLIRAEQIEYFVMESHNRDSAETAFLVCSSLTKCVFAIMVGILFYI